MKIIIQILSLLLVSFVLNAQGADPHGNEDSAITGMVSSDIKNDKNLDTMENQKKITISEKVFTKDEADVKSTIEKFLIVAGNYNLDAMAKMMADKASLAIVRLRDGKWTTETMLVEDHLVLPLNNYEINKIYNTSPNRSGRSGTANEKLLCRFGKSTCTLRLHL